MAPNVFSAILWLTAAIAAVLGVVTWRQRAQPGRRLLAALGWAVALWCFGYGAELGADNLEKMRFWTVVQYPGIVLVSPLWLLFAVRYTRIREFRNRLELALIFAVPTLAIIAVWTNGWHHLYYSAEYVVSEANLHLRTFVPGPIYIVHLVYAWGCVLLGTLALARGLPATTGPFVSNMIMLLIAVLVPFGLALARAFGWQMVGPLDPTPFGFAVSVVLLAAMVARRSLLMLRPIARDIVIDSLEHGLMTVDADGRITDANTAMAAMLGKTPGRVLGRWWEVLPDMPAWQPLMESDTRRTAVVTMGEGAKAQVLEVTATPLRNESGEPIGRTLIFRDITAQREAEEALRKRERLLEAEAQAAVRLMSLHDLDTAVKSAIQVIGEAADVDRVYVFENSAGPAGEPVLSQTYEWVRGGVTAQIDNPELRNLPYYPDYGRWYELLRDGQPVQGHVREFPECERPLLEQQDIQSLLVLPIHIDNVFWGFMGFDECHEQRVWSDTEVATLRTAAAAVGNAIARHRAAMELRETLANLRASERRFRSYFELPLTGLVITNPEGIITEANEAFCRILGLNASEVVERPWSDFRVEDEAGDAESGPAAQGPIPSGLTHMRHTLGHTVPVMVAARSVVGEAEGEAYVIVAVHDISELKRKERELEELTRHLQERVDDQTLALRNVTAELEAFEDRVASELGSNLRIAREYAKHLREGTLTDQERANALRHLVDALDTLHDMLWEMHRLHTTGRGAMYQVASDLSQIAERAAAIVRARYPGRHVEVSVQPGLMVQADPRHLEHILVELLDNAWKFTAPVADARVEVGAEDTERGRTYFVRDNGVGFNAAMAGRLFHIFERLHSDEDFAGRGVGLAIVQRLLARNGGHAWAVGEEGRGATIYFTLPAPESTGK